MKWKVDLRDVLWMAVALVLLALLGREWSRARSIAQEVREQRIAEQPLRFNNAYLGEANMFIYYKFGAEAKTDWEGLKSLGIHGNTRVTKSIGAMTGKEAYEELFGHQVEVIEDVESSQTLGRPVYFIRAKKLAE